MQVGHCHIEVLPGTRGLRVQLWLDPALARRTRYRLHSCLQACALSLGSPALCREALCSGLLGQASSASL